MATLKLTSLQAPNQDFIAEGIAAYLDGQLGMPVRFIGDPPWQERERLLDSGEIDTGWICGLPYVLKVDRENIPIELLVAPVMSGLRYQHLPIYFSDVIVRRDSPFTTFDDLRGAAWAYNEPRSQSGYNITRYHLAHLGQKNGFFSRVLQAGAHQTALQMVLDGRVDASAIDSTVLEIELRRRPQLLEELRIISALGPSPIPPYVIHKKVPAEMRSEIRNALLDMHNHPHSQAVLVQSGISHFEQVTNKDYDAVRDMARIAQEVEF